MTAHMIPKLGGARWGLAWEVAECSGCGDCQKGYVPRFDLRDGQPVVPLDLCLEALFSANFEVILARPSPKWEWNVGIRYKPTYGDFGQGMCYDLIEAVLAAANAALDAREAQK